MAEARISVTAQLRPRSQKTDVPMSEDVEPPDSEPILGMPDGEGENGADHGVPQNESPESPPPMPVPDGSNGEQTQQRENRACVACLSQTGYENNTERFSFVYLKLELTAGQDPAVSANRDEECGFALYS